MPAEELGPRPDGPPHPGRHRAHRRHPWWRSRIVRAVGAVALVVLVAGAVVLAVVLPCASRQPAPPTASSPGAADLVTFLRAQLPPYAPVRISATTGGVLVDYGYLSDPDAVVTTASS